jgi:2-amino-4-hydroxy-6-hydroxymethyldihydropteridine diphosphokinase
MNARVYVGIGSNQQRESRIRQAVAALRERFGPLQLSPVYNSPAFGFDGSDFLNLVAGFDTERDIEAVVDAFHAIEDRLGRNRSLPKFASRPIDLDILLYGDLVMHTPKFHVPRSEILEHPFVLKPLQDLDPEGRHPETGESYRELWQRMAPNASRLELFDLDLSE